MYLGARRPRGWLCSMPRWVCRTAHPHRSCHPHSARPSHGGRTPIAHARHAPINRFRQEKTAEPTSVRRMWPAGPESAPSPSGTWQRHIVSSDS
eukprot:695686-Rhodomonas_salina.2